MMLDQYLRQTLADLEQQGLRRSPRHLTGPQGRRMIVDGQDCLNFCSNDYLGLAGDPRLTAAAQAAMQAEGFGAGASRLAGGDLAAHRRLEQELAAFKGTADALVFSSGYMANVGIISALFGPGDLILADRLNHASIIDGIRLSQARFRRYPHRDLAALRRLLSGATGFRRRLIVTDSVFSMDGDTAPLAGITALAEEYEAAVMVDEAHGLGVFGAQGRGVVEYLGLDGRVDIQMGTLSKAVGASGAYCAGSAALVECLRNQARSYIYTTGMPSAVAAAARQGLAIIAQEPQRRARLWANARFVLAALRQAGFDTLISEGPIIPVCVRDDALAVDLSRRLFARGIYAAAIRPPTVPRGTARLRLTVTAAHTDEDLRYLVDQLIKEGASLCR